MSVVTSTTAITPVAKVRSTSWPAGSVPCDSYVCALEDGIRVEDEALPGFERCPQPATWRVTFHGTTTDTGDSALRLKCSDCANAAFENFGPSCVTMRPLAA